MDDNWDVASYVLQSDYRQEIISTLSGANQATPSQLADETDIAQPNVSRALSELKKKGVVELLVPEETKRGRYYGLTDLGQRVVERVRAAENEFIWELRTPETDTERRLVTQLREEFGEHLRGIACRDGYEVTILYMAESVRTQYTPEELESELQWLLFDDVTADFCDPELSYLVRGFEDRVQVCVFDGEESEISVWVSSDYPFESEALAKLVTDVIDGEEQ